MPRANESLRPARLTPSLKQPSATPCPHRSPRRRARCLTREASKTPLSRCSANRRTHHALHVQHTRFRRLPPGRGAVPEALMVLAPPDHHELMTTGRIHGDRPRPACPARRYGQLGREIAEVERLPFDLSALDARRSVLSMSMRATLACLIAVWTGTRSASPAAPGGVAFRPPRCGLVPDRYRLPLLRPADRAHAAFTIQLPLPARRDRVRERRVQMGAVARLARV